MTDYDPLMLVKWHAARLRGRERDRIELGARVAFLLEDENDGQPADRLELLCGRLYRANR